jgi:DNA polymerase I-like protein with 3'-5' exonuclease and polymerase domains
MNKKEVCNYPGQGSAFHCLLKTFIDTDAMIIKEKLSSRLIGQIHDSEILTVLPDECAFLKERINKIATEDLPNAWKWINVPLAVDFSIGSVDQPWSEKIEE